VFQLAGLRHRAEELLAAELAKGNVYTKEQYLMKKDNMAQNYATLQRLNQEGNMEEFQHKLNILKDEKDLYFEKFELIEEYVEQNNYGTDAQMRERQEKAEKQFKKDHSEFIERMKKEKEDRAEAIKQREKAKREKEEEKKKKAEEEAELARQAKKEAIQQKMQDVHDKR